MPHRLRTHTHLLILLATIAGPALLSAGCHSASPPAPYAGGDGDDYLVFDPPGGTFSGALTVSISTNVEGGTISYSLVESDPTESDADDATYTVPLELTRTMWLRARVTHPDGEPGPIRSAVYLAVEPALEGFDSNLPLVVIDAFGRDIDEEWEPDDLRPYRPISAVFIDTDASTGRASILGEPDFAGHCGMHVRGSSSADYDKKQYKLETWDEADQDLDTPLLGLPEESDWILHAPYSDKTLMRNYSIYSWSNTIGRYATRGVFVELFHSKTGDPISMDDYRGVYVLMEKIKRDKNRVAITKLEPHDDSEPAISGGYLLVKDWWDEWVEDAGFDAGFVTDHYEDEIQYEYPKPHEITGAQREWIKDHFDEFEAVLASDDFTDPVDGYNKYIDLGSFIDHHLLVEIGRNVDGYVLSTFLFKDRGGKINMGPIWDYNGSLGNADYFEAWETAGWHFEFDGFPEDNPNAFEWYERLMEDPAFHEARAERWVELRAGPLATDQLMADIDDAAALLAEAAERNFERWDILGEYVWPNDEGCEDRQTYQEEVDYLKQWLADRLAWLDTAIGG